MDNKEEAPLLDKDKKKEDDKADKMSEKDSSESSESESSSFAPSSNESVFSKDSNGDPKDWDDDKFIWRRRELDQVNKCREKSDMLAVVYRQKYSYYGIRSYPDLGFWKSLLSAIIPWTNEFISIWLNAVFALYFWIESFLIMAKGKEYEFDNDNDYFYIYIATVTVAVYLTITCIYLIFYSMGGVYNEWLTVLVYMAQITLPYAFTFCFMATELKSSDDFFPVLFIIVVLFGVTLVLAQYELGRKIGFWLTIGVLGTIVFFDLCLNSNKHRISVMYIPLIIEGLLLGVGVILYIFQIPDRYSTNTKFINLYFQSYIIFTLLLINFLFEAINILYYVEKLNSHYLDDDDEWWKTHNIYNTS